MIGWSVTFLIVALIAGVFGFSGTAGATANAAWVLFMVSLVLAIVLFIGASKESRRHW